MPEESNLLRPYSYSENHRSKYVTYNFVTAANQEYYVYFSDGSGYFPNYPHFCDDIVTFGFGTNSSATFDLSLNRRHDSRIRDTLFAIIQDSFSLFPQRAILIMCDTNDGRQACRNNLFHRWYNELGRIIDLEISKYNITILGPGDEGTYLIMLIPISCFMHDQIRDAFWDINNEMISKGL